MMNESPWQVIGASVQGTSHQKNRVPCQDAHAYRLLPDGTLIMAIADGAGTAERSAEGAILAVNRVITSIETTLRERLPPSESRWITLMNRAFRQTHQALLHQATSNEVSAQEFATTLACAVISDRWLATGQIGDGIAVVQAEDGHLFTALQPQRGEYANETCFLTMTHALQHVEVQIYQQPVQALAIMTDGLMRLAINIADNSPHLPFFRPLLEFALQMSRQTDAQQQLVAFLSSERVCARTEDDKTVILAVRKK